MTLRDQVYDPEYLHNVFALLMSRGANINVLRNPYAESVALTWFNKFKEDQKFSFIEQDSIVGQEGVWFVHNCPEVADKLSDKAIVFDTSDVEEL